MTSGERSALGLGLPESQVLNLKIEGTTGIRAAQRLGAAQ